MNKEVVKKISKHVYSRFPEMKGSKPKIKQSKIAARDQNYIFTYNTTAQGPGSRTLPRFVRVVVDQRGKIIRMSTSR
jgi:hypothetical protein